MHAERSLILLFFYLKLEKVCIWAFGKRELEVDKTCVIDRSELAAALKRSALFLKAAVPCCSLGRVDVRITAKD